MHYIEEEAEFGTAMLSVAGRIANFFGGIICLVNGHKYKLEYDERKRVRLHCINCGHIKRI